LRATELDGSMIGMSINGYAQRKLWNSKTRLTLDEFMIISLPPGVYFRPSKGDFDV
jgi:hypothetical protein